MIVVRFDHISKTYDLYSGNRTLVSSLKMVTGSSKSDKLFYALSDISFEIHKGEAFGIIGRNGAGKSTILKIIAGITKPSSGTVEVNGLVSSLIELGAGFHPDMTGRENVYMSAAILGISKKIMNQKFKEIVDFAELWDFIDVPIKKYSSGMYARLGFAVAVSVDPEILIIDEILSVGDVFFQQRCFAKMREIIERGTTFIFVTHDTAAMQNLCDRALLLDGGKAEFLGSTTEAVNRYYAKVGQKPAASQIEQKKNAKLLSNLENEVSVGTIVSNSILKPSGNRHGKHGLEIIALRVTDSDNEDTLSVHMEGRLLFHLLLRANEKISEPRVGLNLYDRMGNLVFAAGSPQLRHQLPTLERGQHLIVTLELQLSVGPGEYTFTVNASEPSDKGGPNAGYFHDVHEMLGPINVTADEQQVYPFYGITKLPLKIFHCIPFEHHKELL